jgi:hypothetical protein
MRDDWQPVYGKRIFRIMARLRGQDFDGCEVHHWVEATQLKRQRKPRQ